MNTASREFRNFWGGASDPCPPGQLVDGQVHGYLGLCILDRSTVPAATGANPSPTFTGPGVGMPVSQRGTRESHWFDWPLWPPR
jgi:hypothetical protein